MAGTCFNADLLEKFIITSTNGPSVPTVHAMGWGISVRSRSSYLKEKGVLRIKNESCLQHGALALIPITNDTI